MNQRIEDLSVDDLLTLIEEGTGCGCCGGEPERTIKCVALIREKLKAPPHTASDFEVSE